MRKRRIVKSMQSTHALTHKYNFGISRLLSHFPIPLLWTQWHEIFNNMQSISVDETNIWSNSVRSFAQKMHWVNFGSTFLLNMIFCYSGISTKKWISFQFTHVKSFLGFLWQCENYEWKRIEAKKKRIWRNDDKNIKWIVTIFVLTARNLAMSIK